ncbi:hypothetical protein Rhopal_002714-T1 [Rhodotorula paludigena]|uniref:Proteophosphoglycan ppg4 n=1 Tax=Rhodotorula paludigena TaxID=86838 RepID=A0AAV5GJQ0_9BASI|nr:hypothetical protein Rhopal_002714-T1 [Rhodotorula paludigena]
MASLIVEGIEWTGRLGGMTPAGQAFRSGQDAASLRLAQTLELGPDRLVLRNGNQRLLTLTADSIPSLPLGSQCLCDSISFSLPSALPSPFFSPSSTTASASFITAPPLATAPTLDAFPLACHAVIRPLLSSSPSRPAIVYISTTGVRIVECNGQRLAQLNSKSAAQVFSDGIRIGVEYKLGTLIVQLVLPPSTPIRLSPVAAARSPLTPTTPRATPASTKRRRSRDDPPRSAAKRSALDAQQPPPTSQSDDAAPLAYSAPSLALGAPRAQSRSLPRVASGETRDEAELDEAAHALVELCGDDAGDALPEPVHSVHEREEAWQRKEAKWDSVQNARRERLVQQQEARLERERPLLDGTGSGINRLVCIVNGRRAERANPPPPLDLEHPAVAHLAASPRTVDVLLELICAPLSHLGPEVGILEPAEGDPLELDSAQDAPVSSASSEAVGTDGLARYYVRELSFRSSASVLAVLEEYARQYPADKPWASTTADFIRTAPLSPETPVPLRYGGITVASTPLKRLEADSGAAGGSRITSFLQVVALVAPETTRRVFEFVALSTPAATILDANSALVGETERVIISSLTPLALNSADGGRLLSLDPASLAQEHAFVATGRALPADVERVAPSVAPSAETVALLQRHLGDALQLWQALPQRDVGQMVDVATERGERAFTAIKDDLTAAIRREGWTGAFQAILSKDVTKADLDGVETFTGAAAARGPAATALLHGIVLGQDQFDLRFSGMALDLWALQLRHRLVLIAIIICARALIIACPLFILSRSSKSSNLLRSGKFASAFDCLSPYLNSFLSVSVASTPEILESLSSDLKLRWTETPTVGWIVCIGSTAVVQYGPAAHNLALHLAAPDDGKIKYDPALQDEWVALSALVAAKAALVRRALADGLVLSAPLHSSAPELRTFLRAARERAETESCRVGLEDALVKARAKLIESTSALTGLRAIGAFKRREIEVISSGGSAQDASAERVERVTRQWAAAPPKPTFEGPPLKQGDLDLLRPFYTDSPCTLSPALVPLDLIAIHPRLSTLTHQLTVHGSALLDGLPSPLPPVHGCTIGNEQYCSWYLSAREGVEIARSAGGVNRGKGGLGKDPVHAEEVRAQRVTDALEREEAQRAVRGVSLPGSKSAGEMLALFETADREGTGYGARRDLLAHRCSSCEGLHFAYRNKLDSAPHDAACSGRLESVHVLHPSTLLFLADEPVNALKVLEPAVNSEITSIRQMVTHSDDMGKLALLGLAKLEFVSIDTKISVLALDSGVWRGLAALNLILVAQAPDSIKSDDYAWGGNSGASSATTISAILDGDNLVIFNCPEEGCDYVTVIGSRHSSTPQHRHDSRRPYMVLAASQLAAGDSILNLPLHRARRLLFALASPNDQGIKSIVDKRAGKKASTKDREAALEDIRGVVSAWRQRRVGGR